MSLSGFLLNRDTYRRDGTDGFRRARSKPLLNLARPFLSVITRQRLPNIVDLRPLLSPIEEQYTLGSCVGNALASVLEYFYYRTTGRIKIFSRLFIYYNARMMENEVSQRDATRTDSGADIQYAIVSLIKYGCCDEQFWPFYQHLINTSPTDAAYENGEHFRLDEFNRLTHNIDQLRSCLAQGYPFVMAIRIFPSFESNHQGQIPMPGNHEEPFSYRHAVVCVGYIHSERVFIIRNSHGMHWGEQGYGYLPYEYVTNKILTKDLWAIKSIKNIESIPDEQQLRRSASQLDMTEDNFPTIYSSDDDDDDDGEHERVEAMNRYRQYWDKHPQGYQRDFVPSTTPQETHQWMQPAFPPQFPFVHTLSPSGFPIVSAAGSYPYQPVTFGTVPFMNPF